jgi:glutamate racemase
MRIGIFDSGRGGMFVAEKLRILAPNFDYIVVNDTEHAPYGERTHDDIQALTRAAIQPLIASCPVIILACNTATAAAIDELRIHYPMTQFLGFEPMIKSATTLSKNHHITLLATHATVHAPRTRTLIQNFAANCIVDAPDTTDWAWLIDQNRTDEIDLSKVEKSIRDGSDQIIIGCTHYIALEDRLRKFGANALEPTASVAKRLVEITGR